MQWDTLIVRKLKIRQSHLIIHHTCNTGLWNSNTRLYEYHIMSFTFELLTSLSETYPTSPHYHHLDINYPIQFLFKTIQLYKSIPHWAYSIKAFLKTDYTIA